MTRSLAGSQGLAEVGGANALTAYFCLILLASRNVDRKTLAPLGGSVASAEMAADNRARARTRFTRIIPAVVDVLDMSNQGYSGQGWSIDADGKPVLPVRSAAMIVSAG